MISEDVGNAGLAVGSMDWARLPQEKFETVMTAGRWAVLAEDEEVWVCCTAGMSMDSVGD